MIFDSSAILAVVVLPRSCTSITIAPWAKLVWPGGEFISRSM